MAAPVSGSNRLEHWLEEHEQYWAPTATLMIIAIWGFAMFSIAHSHPDQLNSAAVATLSTLP